MDKFDPADYDLDEEQLIPDFLKSKSVKFEEPEL